MDSTGSLVANRVPDNNSAAWYQCQWYVVHLNLCMVSYDPYIGLLVPVQIILIYIPVYNIYVSHSYIRNFDLYCCRRGTMHETATPS